LGSTVRSAYKANLKNMRAGYKKFIPVVLPLDSLGVKQWTAPSPNFDIRTPVLVIIHQTEENSCSQSLHTLTNPDTRRKVSANYLVCKDGTVFKLVNERYRAWQAGVSRWGNFYNINSISLGIELDNTGKEPFTQKQIASLLVILHSIKARYHIATGNFIAHADVAPTRRKDPSVYFPWRELATQGFGYWRDSTLPVAPEDFDCATALRLIGYDIRDTTAAIVAFKRHFVQTDVTPELTDYDKQVLYDIFMKYDR
jgi:N-acetylmuramoyl-L-alanine amidase